MPELRWRLGLVAMALALAACATTESQRIPAVDPDRPIFTDRNDQIPDRASDYGTYSGPSGYIERRNAGSVSVGTGRDIAMSSGSGRTMKTARMSGGGFLMKSYGSNYSPGMRFCLKGKNGLSYTRDLKMRKVYNCG